MKTITNRRGLILILGFLACIIMLNALRPAHGRSQEADLQKQIADLTQKVEAQKKQFDSLKLDYEKFKTAVVERDRSTRELINKQEQRLNVNDQKIGGLIESARQQDGGLRQLYQGLSQQNNAITNINSRLRAKGI